MQICVKLFINIFLNLKFMKKTNLILVLIMVVTFGVTACNLNKAPDKPSNPSPSDGDMDVVTSIEQLYWYCEDADGDILSYDIYFEDNDNPEFLTTVSDITTYEFTENLLPNTKYYWKIVAKDGNGHETKGDIWEFTTAEGGVSGTLTWDKSIIDNSATGPVGLGYNCQIVVDKSNGLHVVYTDRDNKKLKYAYKSDGGTWSTAEIATDASGALASIAIDKDENLHIVYQQTPNGYLQYATKSLSSATWTITDFGLTGYTLAATETYFNLKTDANNGLHLVAANSGGNNFLQYFYKSATGIWINTTLDIIQGVGEQPDIFIKDDVIHVSYGDYNGKLKYATKPIESGTWTKETVFTSTSIYHTAIAVNSSDEIKIVFRDYAGGFKCAAKNTDSWSVSTIDEEYAIYPGIDVSADDIFYSSFSNYGGTGLKLGYSDGTSWATQIIDDADGYNYVQYTDIVCAPNGHIYAVYQIEASNGNILKFADIYWED